MNTTAHPLPGLLIALSLAAGATDAFAFLALNGVFTANMTGNLILVALFQRAHFAATLAGAGWAIVVFGLALYVGFRASRGQTGVRSGFGPLIGAAVFQALTAALWLGSRQTPPLPIVLVLIGLSCIAMALQTVAAKRMGADRSISTTFATGTMTGLVQDIADGVPGERTLRLGIVLALPTGALIGAGLMQVSPALTPSVPTLILIACVLWTGRQLRSASNASTSSRSGAEG